MRVSLLDFHRSFLSGKNTCYLQMNSHLSQSVLISSAFWMYSFILASSISFWCSQSQVIYCFQHWFYFCYCNVVSLSSYCFVLLFITITIFSLCLYLKQVFSVFPKSQHIWVGRVFFSALGCISLVLLHYFKGPCRCLNTKHSILIVWGRQLVFENLY